MKDPENEGLSLPYRIRYRIIYTMLYFLGPAQQSGMRDPHLRMRTERAARVEAARAARLARENRDNRPQ